MILDELLSFDPLDAAEKITGKSYKEDNGSVMLGMLLAQANGAAKEAELRERHDTYHGIKLPELEALLKREGFRQVYRHDFAIELFGRMQSDCHQIWWHDEGMLINFDSYGDHDRLNGGNCYHNWQGKSGTEHRPCGSNGWITGSDRAFAGFFDIREGLLHNIDKMRATGAFMPQWLDRSWLYLYNYADSKAPGYDLKKTTADRIADLPQDVRKAITPCA